MIVQATAENLDFFIPGLTKCSREFTKEAHSEGLRHYVMNPNVFYQSWLSFLNIGMGCLFILLDDQNDVIGALGGACYPDPNNGRLTASEMFWFVKEEKRGECGGMELFKAFENWGRSKNCTVFQMVRLNSIMPETMGKLYKRNGYHECETIYRKEV